MEPELDWRDVDDKNDRIAELEAALERVRAIAIERGDRLIQINDALLRLGCEAVDVDQVIKEWRDAVIAGAGLDTRQE